MPTKMHDTITDKLESLLNFVSFTKDFDEIYGTRDVVNLPFVKEVGVSNNEESADESSPEESFDGKSFFRICGQ